MVSFARNTSIYRGLLFYIFLLYFIANLLFIYYKVFLGFFRYNIGIYFCLKGIYKVFERNKNKNKNVILYILSILFLAIILTSLYLNIVYYVNDEKNEIVSIGEFELDGENIIEKKFKLDDTGHKVLKATFNGDDLSDSRGEIYMVVSRFRGRSSDFFINGHFVGKIGRFDDSGSNCWNIISKMHIKNGIIREGENELSIITFTDYKVGRSGMPIYIGSGEIISNVYRMVKFFYHDFYVIAFGFLLALIVIQLLIYLTPDVLDKRYMVFPLMVILISVMITQYVKVSFDYMSIFSFNKIFYIFMYLTSISFAWFVDRFYGAKWLYRVSIVLGFISIAVVSVASSRYELSKFAYVMNFFMLLLMAIGIYAIIREYRKSRRVIELLIAISLVAFLFLVSLEALTLAVSFVRFRTGAYGYIVLAIGISITYIEIFKDNISRSVAEREKLIKEAEQLKISLVKDEVLDIYNNRYLFDVLGHMTEDRTNKIDTLMISVDKLVVVNETHGYTIGDEILKEVASIIKSLSGDKEHCFRYSGRRFVYIACNRDIDILILADLIRSKIKTSEKIKKLARFLPITISCGIARFPGDGLYPKSIIENAKVAIEVAEIRGGDRIVVYEPALISELEDESLINYKERMFIDFIYSLAAVIDMKDKYTGQHSKDVSKVSVMIAEKLGIKGEDINRIRMGGMLHDFGKIGIPDTIINKKGKLNDEEYEIMKSHPSRGYEIIRKVIDDPKVLEIIKFHHERYDGKGYPNGLIGEEIPLFARIVCVADTYDAMTSDRPYRKALSRQTAIAELKKYSGAQFDAEIVEAFLEVLAENGIE